MARVLISGVSLLIVLTSSAIVSAQQTWPSYPLDGHRIVRGPGSYFAWWKLLLLWLLFLLWVKTMDWINRDTQLLKLNHNLWNSINFFPFFVSFLIVALSLPFAIGYSVIMLAWLAPLAVYIFQRNASVEQHEKVLTVNHVRYLFAKVGQSIGMKIDTEKKAQHELGAPVNFQATSGLSDSKNQANMIQARQSEGFVNAKEVIADTLDRRGTKIMLDAESERVTVRYQIDGVWHEADPMEREVGDPTIGVFKRLSNTDPDESRKRQTGEFTVQYKDQKCRAILTSQGTKKGERTIIHLSVDGLAFDSMEEAGMRQGSRDRLKELLESPQGIILFTSVPGGGLSTTVALAGRMSDRYMRDFTSFQDINRPEPVADNVAITTFDSKRDQVTESLVTVFRKDPDVVFIHELPDKEISEVICERAAEGKLILTTIPAKEAVESLLRVLLLKVSPKAFAKNVVGVVNQRLIRKLCEECKEEYAPSAELRKKLRLPGERVPTLFRPPTPDDDQPICDACGGLGYVGRTSIFELMKVDDSIREALIKQPKLEVLRRVSREAGNMNLQEEGILLVAQGITSLQELTRVLK